MKVNPKLKVLMENKTYEPLDIYAELKNQIHLI